MIALSRRLNQLESRTIPRSQLQRQFPGVDLERAFRLLSKLGLPLPHGSDNHAAAIRLKAALAEGEAGIEQFKAWVQSEHRRYQDSL